MSKCAAGVLLPKKGDCPQCGVGPDQSCPVAATAIQKEIDDLHTLAKELSDALLKIRPLGGSEMFSYRCGAYYADPAYCGKLIDELRIKHFEDIKDRYRKAAEDRISGAAGGSSQ